MPVEMSDAPEAQGVGAGQQLWHPVTIPRVGLKANRAALLIHAVCKQNIGVTFLPLRLILWLQTPRKTRKTELLKPVQV